VFQQFFSDSPLVLWPLLAFVLFFATFTVVCVRLAVGKLREDRDFDHVASLPLDEDDPPAGGE
jgi:hypothetical protein